MSADHPHDDTTDWRAERLTDAFRVTAMSDTSLMGNRNWEVRFRALE